MAGSCPSLGLSNPRQWRVHIGSEPLESFHLHPHPPRLPATKPFPLPSRQQVRMEPMALSGLPGAGNQDTRQQSSSIFSAPVIPSPPPFSLTYPMRRMLPFYSPGHGGLSEATQLANGKARPEPSSCGCRAGVLRRSSVLPLLPSPVGVWTVALFRSGTLASSDSPGIQEAKMLGRPGVRPNDRGPRAQHCGQWGWWDLGGYAWGPGCACPGVLRGAGGFA